MKKIYYLLFILFFCFTGAMAQTFIIDSKGNVAYAHSGYTPGSELQLLKKLKELQKKWEKFSLF